MNVLLFKFHCNIFNAGFSREWDALYNHIRNLSGTSTFSIEHLDSGPDGWKYVADTIQTDGLVQPLFT